MQQKNGITENCIFVTLRKVNVFDICLFCIFPHNILE